MSYCLHCGKPWATHGTVCDTPLVRSDLPGVQPDSDPPASRAPWVMLGRVREQLDDARAQLAQCASDRDALKTQLAAARSDIDRLAALVLEVRAERQQARAALDTARAALEACRPTLKHAAVDGSPDALAALDLVARALAPAPDRDAASPIAP